MELGAVDFIPWLSSRTKSVAVNIAGSGDNTVHTVTSGTRFVVYYIWLQAEAAVTITFKSGASTSISGAIDFALAAEKSWGAGGIPALRGNAVGDNFIINLSGAVQVNGFALVGEIST